MMRGDAKVTPPNASRQASRQTPRLVKPPNTLNALSRSLGVWRGDADHAAQPRSLRLRLALWYGALLAAALLLFGALVTVVTTNAILQSVDSALGAETRIVTLNLDRALSPTLPYWPTTLNLDVVNTYSDPGVTVAIFDADKQARYRSATSASPAVAPTSPAFAAALAGQTSVLTTKVNGERVRVIVMPVRAPTTGASAGSTAPEKGQVIGVLLVAKSLRDVDATLLLLRTVLLLTGLAILAAALLGGWAVTRRVLRPLALISATAQRIATGTARGATAGPLRHRVPRPPGDDELAHLVDTLNEMLTALDHATTAQRRFIADASHELRAPLTTIQGNLAFLQRHANDLPPDERQVMLADAHSETLRLARLVNDLLLLARTDASSDAPSAEARAQVSGADDMDDASDSLAASGPAQVIELDAVALQLARQLRGRLAAEPQRLTLEIGHIEPARVRGDEETVRRIALILLDNAMKYTVAKGAETPGRITIEIARVDGGAALRVADTGIGIAPADLPHVFERFYRADTARQREGTGLGLAIAQTLAGRLHGRITVESEPGHGSIFTLWLPAASAE
jgi:two-component system, OmpR family, sensor kinase